MLQFQEGHTIHYAYDALGMKRRVKALTSGEQLNIPMGTSVPLTSSQVVYTETKDYSSNLVYSNGDLLYVLTPEGYLRRSWSGAWEHVYQFRDHLGSVRKEITGSGEVVGKKSYYASGYNAAWGNFFKAYPNATQSQILNQGRTLM